jgi:DNA ligase 1
MARAKGREATTAQTNESGTLLRFAEMAERVAATTKKLEKAALLGAYLHELTDADLVRAARYFAGQQFAQSDMRTTNVGGSLLRAALSEVTGRDVENLRPRYVRLGDSGEVAVEVMREAGRDAVVQPTFTLAEVENLIETLSATRGMKNKRALLVAALTRATAPEAK